MLQNNCVLTNNEEFKLCKIPLLILYMHNLFLGLPNIMVKKVWLKDENPVIPKTLHSRIQERIDKCVVPSLIGRIPHKNCIVNLEFYLRYSKYVSKQKVNIIKQKVMHNTLTHSLY